MLTPNDRQNEHIDRRFDRLERMLMAIFNIEQRIRMTLDDVTAKVQEETDTENSAITLLENLTELIRGAANDPVKIQAIADQLDANKLALAAAVVANTPTAE